MYKPLIGVMPLYDPALENQWMLDQYLTSIEKAGGLPLVFSVSASQEDICHLLSLVDGILFPGGQDIVPLHYGANPIPACGVHVPQLDALELFTAREACRRKMPVFGICRGIQLLNVAFGGTLYQDLPSELAAEHPVLHNQAGRTGRDWPYHTAAPVHGTLLAGLAGTAPLAVNTLHHQGIRTLAPAFRASAFAPDGLIECIEGMDENFIMAVQWHPELSYDRDEVSRKLFALFVSHAAQAAAAK